MFSISVINKLTKFRSFQPIIRSAKFGPKNKEERYAAVDAERVKKIRNSLIALLQSRPFLSVAEWKKLHTELVKQDVHFKSPNYLKNKIFGVILNLRLPNDSMENAKTLIEAFGLEDDLVLKRTLIQLYSKKASEQGLTDEEEQKLIELFVDLLFISSIVRPLWPLPYYFSILMKKTISYILDAIYSSNKSCM